MNVPTHPASKPNGHAIGFTNGYTTHNSPTTLNSLLSMFLTPFRLFRSIIMNFKYALSFWRESSLGHRRLCSSQRRCPVTGQVGEKHEWKNPLPSDIRSVCPALNTLANHGYISRDGKNLSALQIAYGLKACYGLSTGLALFLSFGGVFLIRGPFKFFFLGALHTINRHFDVKFFGVEHDASLVHEDTPRVRSLQAPSLATQLHQVIHADKNPLYAPTPVRDDMVEEIMSTVPPLPHSYWYNSGPSTFQNSRFLSATRGVSATLEDPRLVDHLTVAKWRILREDVNADPLDGMHAEVARGEMGIILGVWEHLHPETGARGIPAGWLKGWLKENRLPDGWTPDHVQKLKDVVNRSKAIRAEMEKIRGKK